MNMTRPASEQPHQPDKITVELLIDPAEMNIIQNAAYEVNKPVAAYILAKALEGSRRDTVASPRD